MHLPSMMAKQFRDVHFGGNWTSVNLKDAVAGLSWEQATNKEHGGNSIAVIVFHMNYYVRGVLQVLQGGDLTIKDKFSFDLPLMQSQDDWQALLDRTWQDAEAFAQAVEQMPAEKPGEDFIDPKYGTYYRNIAGITEHLHYHLGQIIMLKKYILKIQNAAADH